MITPALGRATAVVALACLAATSTHAQNAPSAEARAYVRSTGPSAAGRALREILARPHRVIVSPDTGIVLGRATSIDRTLLVIGGPARLEGRVRGDVVVLGELVLRPGARIDGRAIAYGGLLLNSTLASVRGGRDAFPDVGFRATLESPGVYALDYVPTALPRVRVVTLPGVFGLRVPTYDRIDGVSIPLGPEFAFDTGRVTVDPTITYRSHLGAFDPELAIGWRAGRRVSLDARAGRVTRTNDAWIRGDLVNSATTLFAGNDARNYYRADRAELTVAREADAGTSIVSPYLGASLERAWSAARDTFATSVPWSAFRRHDAIEGMRRANPGVSAGSIGSALGGLRVRSLGGPIALGGEARIEVPFATTSNAHWTQLTLDAHLAVPTFRDQSIQLLTHDVATLGDVAPAQRFAYLGGGSTIPTLDLLSQGGDRLLWLDSRYIIPIDAITLPVGGAPRLTLRHVVGGAGVGRLPTLTQNVGVRVNIAMLRVEYMIDPAHRERHAFSFGFGAR